MGRRAEGYKVRWRGARRGYTVRFTVRGERKELATGVRNRKAKAEADREAQRIYAEHITGQRRQAQQRGRAPDSPLLDRVSEWLEDLTVRERTRTSYESFSLMWIREFKKLSEMTEPRIASYTRRRLREALRKTVANELSGLRRFSVWLLEQGHLEEPLPLPVLRKHVEGTKSKRPSKQSAPELSPAEVRKLIAALPERGRMGLVVRPRFVFAYETSLRPTTIDKLKVPENYTRGASELVLTDADDKEMYGRVIPLTKRARAALDSVCPEAGLIFGAHDYYRHIRTAALKALSAGKAKRFAGAHFRSAAITHLLERTGNIPGVQYLAGHKHTSTTAKYVKPSLRAARDVLRKVGG